jgi:ABC-type Na+ efflux pump permease subunit
MLWVVSFVVLFIVYEVVPKLTTVVPTKALVAISAPASMVMEMVPFMGGGGPPFAHPHWAWHVLFTLCLTALFFWFTTISIRRAMHATALHGPGAGRGFKKKQDNTRKGVVVEAQGSPQNTDVATTTVASSERQAELHSEGSTKRKRTKSTVVEGISRTVGDNPVLWREFQQRMTRGQWAMPVGTGFCICALLFIYWMASLQEGTQISLAIGGAVLLMVLASLQTTSAISSEREGRTLEVLLTTPLTARQIVWGKMLGACKRILPFLLIIALHLFFSGVIPHITRFIFLPLDHFVKFARFMGNDITIALDGPEHIHSWRSGGGVWAPSFVSPLSIVIMLWVLAVTLFFQLASGIFLSTVMKRSTAAAVTNLLLALVVWLFLPIGLAIIDNDLVDTYGAIHPVVLMAMAIKEGTNHSLIHQHFDVPDGGTSFAGFMVCVMLYSAIALVISWGALKLAALEIGFSGGRKR